MSTTARLIMTSCVAFGFYSAWSYFANSLVTDDASVLIQSALVQGSYSAFVTLMFTFILEKSVKGLYSKMFCLAFVVPIMCTFHSKTAENIAIRQTLNDVLDSAAIRLGNQLPAVAFAPLLPLAVQSVLVIAVNVVNQTPNLWLTVAPSILLSGIYGYSYMFSLLKDKR